MTTHFLLVDHGRGIGTCFTEVIPGLSFLDAIGLIPEYDAVIAVYCADEEIGTFRDVTSDVADYLSRQAWDELGRAAQEICHRFGVAPAENEDVDGLDGHEHQRREAACMGHFA